MTSTGDRTAQTEWIRRVLGVAAVSSNEARASADGIPIFPQWNAACEEVGAEIAKLQDAMRGTDRPLLQRIADRGLNGVTGRLKVGLHVALTEFDQASPERKPLLAGKARTAIAAFQAFLQSDRVIPLLESNPLGVAVNVRSRLGAALMSIEAGLPR